MKSTNPLYIDIDANLIKEIEGNKQVSVPGKSKYLIDTVFNLIDFNSNETKLALKDLGLETSDFKIRFIISHLIQFRKNNDFLKNYIDYLH